MKLTIEQVLISAFKGSRNTEIFTHFTDEQYAGYITAMSICLYGNKLNMPVLETLDIATELILKGIL